MRNGFLRLMIMPALACLFGAWLHAQEVPIGAEGREVRSIDLSTAVEGKVFDRAPESAPRHKILANMRTREGKPFSSADLARDIERLTKEEFLFRNVDWRVEFDRDAGIVRVRLILTQPLIWRMRVVAPREGRFTEDAMDDFWRSRSRVDSAEGAEFSITRLDADVRALSTGERFLDVRAEYVYTQLGVDVLFKVIPNKPVAIVRFSGINQTGFRSDLEKVLAGQKPIREPPGSVDIDMLNLPRYFPPEAFRGEVVTSESPASIAGAVALAEEFYRAGGFAFVAVKPRVIEIAPEYNEKALLSEYGQLSEDTRRVVRELVDSGYRGRLVLILEVFEGPRVLVGDIYFDGLEGTRSPPGSDALSAARFRGLMSPVYQLWYGLLSGVETERAAVLRDAVRTSRGNPFVEADAVRDAEVLQNYLQQRGWLDARVSFSNVQWNSSRTRVNVVFQFAPGPIYAVTEVRFEYATRFPRVPQGVARPDYDAPVATFEELVEAMKLEADLMSPSQALERWGAEYIRFHTDSAEGRHFAAFTLARVIPWDEYLLNGETMLSPGLSGRVRELLASRGFSNIELELLRVETQAGRLEIESDEAAAARRVGMVVRLQQGYRSYVGNVTFRGNESTREDVVRRQVALYPGEVFNANLLNASNNRLRRSQWFEMAAPGQGVMHRTSVRRIEIGDQIIEYTDVDYELIEGRTNSFNFVAGYSTANGFTASLDLTLRNFDISSLVRWMWGDPQWSFTGAGQQFSISLSPPLDRQQTYKVNFVEPWLFGYPLSGGIAAEYTTIDRVDYSQGRAGVDPFVGWRVFSDVVWSFGYSYSIVSLFDVSPAAPAQILADEGEERLSQLWSQIEWTTTDNPQFPTTGFNLSYRYSYTGGVLGGTLDFWRMVARAQVYLPVYRIDETRDLVLALSVGSWWQDVHSNTREIPFIERFLLGGNPMNGRGILRGYEYGGVGPSRDDNAVGGNFMLAGFAELRFPVFPGSLWLVSFIDAGHLSPTLNTFDGNAITVSGGFGLRLLLPVLPVPFALDFGFPIIRQPGNREEVISINLGFGF